MHEDAWGCGARLKLLRKREAQAERCEPLRLLDRVEVPLNKDMLSAAESARDQEMGQQLELGTLNVKLR